MAMSSSLMISRRCLQFLCGKATRENCSWIVRRSPRVRLFLGTALGGAENSRKRRTLEVRIMNGARGMRDIEGKVAMVATRMEPRGRERHGWENREVDMGGST